MNSLLMFITVFGCTSIVADNTVEGGTECMPQLADRCFVEIYDKIPCQLKFNSSSCPLSNRTSVKSDVNEFCKAFSDSLDCLSDIIDNDCSNKDGKDIFDVWLNGLRAVNVSLCEKFGESFKVMVENARCWNGTEFLYCITKYTRLRHVIDLMHSALDFHETILVISRLAECNLSAGLFSEEENNPCSLIKPKELVIELIHIFFSQTYCNKISQNFCNNKNRNLV